MQSTMVFDPGFVKKLKKTIEEEVEKNEELLSSLKRESDDCCEEWQPSRFEGVDSSRTHAAAKLQSTMERINRNAARLPKYLKHLKKTLEMLEKGEFNGLCIDCGMPIPQERLLAVPCTRKCVPCKDKERK